MEQLTIRADAITEEKILELVNFLDTWKLPEGVTESKLAYLYWRLKARGSWMEQADQWLKHDYDRKKESYKWKVINEIQQGIEDMRNENWLAWHYRYEIANIKEREKGRTMQLWFQDIDVNDKVKWRHSVLIKERENPEFFEEMLNKYRPQETTTLYDKPF